MELLEEILLEARTMRIPFADELHKEGLLRSFKPDYLSWLVDTRHNLEYIVHDFMNTGRFDFSFISESTGKGRFCLLGVKKAFPVGSLPWDLCRYIVLLEQDMFEPPPRESLSYLELTFLSGGENGTGFQNPQSKPYAYLQENGFTFMEEQHALSEQTKVFAFKDGQTEWFINNKSLWKTIATKHLIS